ncbi:MAG: hypothetical protein Q8O40_09385 [Chloroflexota bacterium]|nr:hypothetical protein [Chloroflexota bacterium]
MSRKSIKNGLRAIFSLSVTVAVVVSVLLSPAVTMGLTATNQTNKAAASLPPNYKLGELVTFTSEVIFAEGETKDISKVHWRITGPQPLDVDLPIIDTAGSFLDITYLLPVDFTGARLGQLKAKIEIVNLAHGSGYGYGYKGKTGGGKIKYTLKYLPPVLKHPAPSPLPGPMNNPTFAFPVPGGAGGGTNELKALPHFSIPGVPGSPPGSTPVGLAYDSDTDQLLILVHAARPLT